MKTIISECISSWLINWTTWTTWTTCTTLTTGSTGSPGPPHSLLCLVLYCLYFQTNNLLQAGRFNFTPRGEIQLPKVNGKTQKKKNNHVRKNKRRNNSNRKNKQKHKLKKDNGDKKHLLNFLFQGGLMATYWLVGRKEEERDD